jgi:hypothetical protein
MKSSVKIRSILAAFKGDKEIELYCDPSNPDKTDSGVAVDTYKKIMDWESVSEDGVFKDVVVDDRVVGFIYTIPGRLVSFGVNPNYRVKTVLKQVFESVVDTVGPEFECSMWSRNERGIKWLQRCGMSVVYSDEEITNLIYKECR